ncbi:MAG: 50S ribosomal protein L13 [Candidatus Omnitrophica bacterium]|nr:50S ribosomal protein L13 [Candidatus Omnitrophota bacterium]
MFKTYVAKKSELKRQWYIMDARDKILGRLASKAAIILRGKHKPNFTPHLDTGDGVIIINAAKIKVTGRKLKEKVYRRFSGYPGGLREVSLETLLKKRPATVLQLAVRRMLPGGPLGRRLIKKLRVYADEKYPQKGLKLIELEA